MVGWQEGAGFVGVDHSRGLERVFAARRSDAREDQEQPGVRSIRSRATRVRDAVARSLRPAGLLATLAGRGETEGTIAVFGMAERGAEGRSPGAGWIEAERVRTDRGGGAGGGGGGREGAGR